MALGIIALNFTLSWLDGDSVRSMPTALMTAEPAWTELIVTVAIPFTVVALRALNMPRVVKKLTVRPSGIFMPFLCHSTLTL